MLMSMHRRSPSLMQRRNSGPVVLLLLNSLPVSSKGLRCQNTHLNHAPYLAYSLFLGGVGWAGLDWLGKVTS